MQCELHREVAETQGYLTVMRRMQPTGEYREKTVLARIAPENPEKTRKKGPFLRGFPSFPLQP